MEKYRATIHGNTIEWDDDAPTALVNNGSLKVEVSVVPALKKRSPSDRKKIAAALEALAALPETSGLKSIKDPVKWQRAIRKDRPLPGR